MGKPLHIVMTPVRNEAWVLRAFLNATSVWADYIVVADQMSTDGSRDIYKDFPKVTVIDNPDPEFNEPERQAILIAKAREIAAGRDTLLWGLDADEIIAANAFGTRDWQLILDSSPGAVFWFKWAQLTYDRKHWFDTNAYYPWLFHDDGKEPHCNYVRKMHSMRIPYPIGENDMHYVDDFRVLHLGTAPLRRVKSKERFYMFVDWQQNGRNPYKMGRAYIGSNDYPVELKVLPSSWVYSQVGSGFDMWKWVDLDLEHCWMDDYVAERLRGEMSKGAARLPIWSQTFVSYYNLKDPRCFIIRAKHRYLRMTQRYRKQFWVKVFDRILFSR